MKQKPTMEILIFFINPKDKPVLTSLLSSFKPILQICCNAKGAGESNNADFWGFSIVDKEVVFALVPFEKSKEILDRANELIKFEIKHQGLGVSLPIKSSSSALFEKFIKGVK